LVDLFRTGWAEDPKVRQIAAKRVYPELPELLQTSNKSAAMGGVTDRDYN
jgi:hypothetical protein